ncbi:ubiquitin C-terminal hydrolase 12-like [Argentina anserina]|uniref:ubiquitin C-terminal hydrolase 12-like n=1 Tax=Argentina anserina TaxID=57926 RepID=UPI0021762C60|nr:ubiquitin C-terminal hydrolase 12-like [Potentilla anserina]
MVARTRLISHRKLMFQEAGNIVIPRSYRLKSHYVQCMKKVKHKEGDDLAPVTFTWEIDNFSKLDAASKHYSDTFVIGNFKWRILLYLKGIDVDYLSPYLDVINASKLPQGWARCAHFSLTVVNQLHPSKSITKDAVHIFNACDSDCGFKSLVPLSWLSDHGHEYLVNDVCILEAKVELHQVKGKNSEDKITACSAPVEQGPEMDSSEAPDLLATCKELKSEQIPSCQDAPSFEESCTELTSLSYVEDVHQELGPSNVDL